MRAKLVWLVGLLGALTAATLSYVSTTPFPRSTPEAVRYGYVPEERQTFEAEVFAWSQPGFQLVDAEGRPVVQDNARANVRLWQCVTAANGSYPQNKPQLIGDCTGHGGKHAIEGTSGGQIAGGQKSSWRPVDSTFLYAAGRVFILKGSIRGDGATGHSIAQAAKEYGVLPADDPRLPPYTAEMAREWGRKGPPQWAVEEAAKYKVRTVALMRTPAEVRDAVCNGYGVTIASSYGSTDIRPRDGRMVARRNTSWNHQMCIDGYDGSTGTPYWHVKNSWGENEHPQPIDDSPPGGFWITEKDLEFILRNNGYPDSWAFSDFDGFPVRALKFDFLSQRRAAGKTDRSTSRTLVATRGKELAL